MVCLLEANKKFDKWRRRFFNFRQFFVTYKVNFGLFFPST